MFPIRISTEVEALLGESTTVFPHSLTGRKRSTSPAFETPLPRLHSSPGDLGETHVSDVISELALLADPSSVPQLNHDLSGHLVLSPPEAAVAALVIANMKMRDILDRSPLREDETLEFLATLVTERVITITREDLTGPHPN